MPRGFAARAARSLLTAVVHRSKRRVKLRAFPGTAFAARARLHAHQVRPAYCGHAPTSTFDEINRVTLRHANKFLHGKEPELVIRQVEAMRWHYSPGP
jgi:hypothetical protein